MAIKGKVLIVDDDPDLVEVMRTALESDGFAVYSAADGTQGLNLMRQEKPDLVFLDVIMAHPTEGVDVSTTMKEDPALWDIPVVMLTSIVDTEYLGHFPTDQPLAVDQFLTKPLPLSEVLRIANEAAGQDT
ncbi:MAG: response regulator [Ardenticatenia bacterium]|nr:response regulator [Ardenticatenia bacterium]